MNTEEKINLFKDALIDVSGQPNFIIQEDTQLKDLGLDSLTSVEIQLFIEEKLNRELPDPQGKLNTVKDIIDLIP